MAKFGSVDDKTSFIILTNLSFVGVGRPTSSAVFWVAYVAYVRNSALRFT